jgi:hypothetical protein
MSSDRVLGSLPVTKLGAQLIQDREAMGVEITPVDDVRVGQPDTRDTEMSSARQRGV